MERKYRFAQLKVKDKPCGKWIMKHPLAEDPGVFMGHIVANNLREAAEKARSNGFFINLEDTSIQEIGPVQVTNETGEWVTTEDYPR